MAKRHLVNTSLLAFLSLSTTSLNAQERAYLEDYCFQITPTIPLGIRNITTTPEDFLKQDPNIEAAINGVYFGSDNQPEGLVFLAENHHLATEKPEHMRGYFTINKKGTKVKVSEILEGELKDYWLVIGTHPLLVYEGNIHPQAREVRYSSKFAQRSAIGTKNERAICFAVSRKDISVEDWAKELKSKGYTGAINLDGGPYSQLAIKNKSPHPKKDRSPTRQIIFRYRK